MAEETGSDVPPMLKVLRQARAAFSLLNPSQVRDWAERPISIRLEAAGSGGFAAMEDFLLPASVSHERRTALMDRMFRTGDPGAPDRPDLILCEPNQPCSPGAFAFDPAAPEASVHAIISQRDDLTLPLARSFPRFRKPVIDNIVMAVARENALFAVATALPNILPSILDLPWAVGEFASDTAFLTMNQVRMAFLIAACCGKPVGAAGQKIEIGSIVATAFGWRAIARELAGKIPLGGGLIPKGAIAFAGTWVVGKGLEKFNTGAAFNGADRHAAYTEGLEHGRAVVRGALET